MNVVALHGLKGGVGTTTVVANLAAAIHSLNRPVLAIDLCAQNNLRLHFAMGLSDNSGFATQVRDHQPWHQAAYVTQTGIQFLPFGQDDYDGGIAAMENLMQKNPFWLENWLEQLDLPEETWVLLDCPIFPSPYNHAGMAVANTSILVLNPESLSYTALHGSNRTRYLEFGDELNQLLLLNRYCPAIELERDITSLLKADFDHALLPITIHRDESLRESLAYKKTVIEAAPASQSAQDFSLAALWLTSRADKLRDIRKQQASDELQIVEKEAEQETP